MALWFRGIYQGPCVTLLTIFFCLTGIRCGQTGGKLKSFTPFSIWIQKRQCIQFVKSLVLREFNIYLRLTTDLAITLQMQ